MGKAQIVDLDSPSNMVECMFNPKEITYSKQNTWSMSPKKGQNIPKAEFGGGGAMQLQVELFFDTTEKGIKNATDVRDKTKKLWKMMLVVSGKRNPETHKSQPPKVRFQWGSMLSFTAIIQSINQRFTLFNSDGTPVRATLSVTFQQCDEAEYVPQNPTSAGSPGYKMRMVREGDALDLIAYQEYGDSSLWRVLAEANRIDDPMKLLPGQMLSIPSLL
ncbi:MAG: LysM peptidoglycan-binding domain-containing protein [Dehalococcoidia bacterium]|nr:LysM peptidoglycan-binding domain-containing protein [Dehalococcoidia bacterium]